MRCPRHCLLTRVTQDGRVGSGSLLSGLSGFRLGSKVSVNGDLHWFVVYGEVVGHLVAEGLIRYLSQNSGLNCGCSLTAGCCVLIVGYVNCKGATNKEHHAICRLRALIRSIGKPLSMMEWLRHRDVMCLCILRGPDPAANMTQQ